MLKDTVRTDAYRDFIYQNKHLFAGKTVLDVGCGTGILSMFCAKAGARVIAVDNSAIIDKARENVFNNGLQDDIVCLRGKIEDVTLPVERVDVIVSEWMGYCLLYEAMLDSVIYARDRYLRPDGLMVPSHMNLWLAPVADPTYVADHVAFWRDVYGFDMKAMQAGIHDEALVMHMSERAICGRPFMFGQLSLHTTTVKDLSFRKRWQSALTDDVECLDGFAVWFDSFFMPRRDAVVPLDARAESWPTDAAAGVAFTTGPYGRETHWKQALMLIDNHEADAAVTVTKGEKFHGEIEYSVPEDNTRALNVTITWNKDGGEPKTQCWKMK
jgi:protein arginine N-methyltransferase 3